MFERIPERTTNQSRSLHDSAGALVGQRYGRLMISPTGVTISTDTIVQWIRLRHSGLIELGSAAPTEALK